MCHVRPQEGKLPNQPTQRWAFTLVLLINCGNVNIEKEMKGMVGGFDIEIIEPILEEIIFGTSRREFFYFVYW